MPKEARKKDMQIQTEKNTETYSRTNLYNQGILYFPTKVNDPDEVETCLVPNSNLEFYDTELSDLFKSSNSHWNITAPAYYVLTNSRDDQFIREMIADAQTNEMLSNKLEEMIEEAFAKYSNSNEAIEYLFGTLLEDFLTNNSSLRVIY